jgi:hypothetical protein
MTSIKKLETISIHRCLKKMNEEKTILQQKGNDILSSYHSEGKSIK